MTKHCNECKQPLTFAERWGIRTHVCDEDILAALAYKAQEEHKQYLERKRIQQERNAQARDAMAQRQLELLRTKQAAYKSAYGAPTTPVRSSSGSSRRVSNTDDTYDYAVMNAFSPSYSSYSSDSSSSDSSSSYSSSCDSSSSSSDSGSCSLGD